MYRNDRVRACYQHCCLRYVMNQKMTNRSLRERFKLPEKNHGVRVAGDQGCNGGRDCQAGRPDHYFAQIPQLCAILALAVYLDGIVANSFLSGYQIDITLFFYLDAKSNFISFLGSCLNHAQ